MKMQLTFTLVMTAAVLVPDLSGATSLASKRTKSAESSSSSSQDSPMTNRGIVKQYVVGCSKKPAKGVKKEPNCDKLRKETVEIVKDSLHTLGSSTKRTYLPAILKIFKSDEVELRIAAADAFGMIGPQDGDAELLAALTNDPVPDVRVAVGQAIGRGKGPSLSLLGQRVLSTQTGITPDSPPDPGKLPLPVLPKSTYLYYASDASIGRVSYVVKDLNETAAFYKGKAKKGPFKLEEFQDKYRYQLRDEDQAKSHADDAESAKQPENLNLDPAKMQATLEKMVQRSAAQTKRMRVAVDDMYQPSLFDKPAVYILEERQIGSRSYPTRYVVLYQDLALKRPGYRLAWMTVPDTAVKTAQATSLEEEKQEAARNKEAEALKKRGEALENLIQKKGEQEKSKFKKGQADLEKELGF